MNEVQAQVVSLIRVVATIGKGTQEDPIRTEVSYWTEEGALLVHMNINDDPYYQHHP